MAAEKSNGIPNELGKWCWRKKWLHISCMGISVQLFLSPPPPPPSPSPMSRKRHLGYFSQKYFANGFCKLEHLWCTVWNTKKKNAIWEKQIKGPIGRGMWRETGVIIKEEIWLALCCMSTKWQQRCSAITQAARSLKVMASSARDNCLHTCRTNSYCAHPLLPSDKCTDCWGMRSATWK